MKCTNCQNPLHCARCRKRLCTLQDDECHVKSIFKDVNEVFYCLNCYSNHRPQRDDDPDFERVDSDVRDKLHGNKDNYSLDLKNNEGGD